MKLIKKLGRIRRKNSIQSFGTFLCSYCNKEVEKQLGAGKRDKSCGCMHDKLLSESLKGEKNPMHGKFGEKNPFYGKHHTEDTKRKNAEFHKDKKHTEETKQKISEIFTGKGNPFYGKHHTEETKQKISMKNKDKLAGENNYFYGKSFSGEKNPNWQGGKSFEFYGPEFNKELKDFIKQRDNHQCQNIECFDDNKKLDVHHIDYDKQNNNLNNLITLCKSCHMKTNFNREYHQNYYLIILMDKINGS